LSESDQANIANLDRLTAAERRLTVLGRQHTSVITSSLNNGTVTNSNITFTVSASDDVSEVSPVVTLNGNTN
jgi:hypothetical protein